MDSFKNTIGKVIEFTKVSSMTTLETALKKSMSDMGRTTEHRLSEATASTDDKVSLAEFEKSYMHKMNADALSLYQEDLKCNAESIHGVVKKTVDSNITQDMDRKKTGSKANLGTFFGVFLPCCQNIVGVIYFVRMPWIIGCAGVLEGSAIVLICCGMSICTALSMSAIATNGRVTAGGTYFMISRSLGPAFGGSLGVLFFMGTSISVAMYYLGTIETLLTYIAPKIAIFGVSPEDPKRYHDYRLFGSCLLIIMTTVVFLGVKIVSRLAFCAIIFLFAALLSIFLGFIMASPETSARICVLGDHVMKFEVVHPNNTWECHKNKTGPLYDAYCKKINGTDVCEEYFVKNEAKLLPGIPGFRKDIFIDAIYNHYTEIGNIPGTNTPANHEREIISIDHVPQLSIDQVPQISFVQVPQISIDKVPQIMESGSNYSGDLRDAQISIPRGTIAAAFVTSFMYFSSVILMSGSVEGKLLRDKYGESISMNGELVLSLMAFPSKWVVLVGTLTATIGAGLQALAGGPRLLQAIADDNIIPHLSFFAQKWRGEPVRCLIVTFFIAEMGILIAFLDYVAPIVTMFFLMCYGFINFAVTLQSLLDTPHWRPSFRYYHWSLTLFGTCLCLATMFICSWKYAIVALVIAALMYQYMEYKGAEKEWGDGMTGLNMSGALYALMRLKQDYKHIKNWRPQVLVLLKMSDINFFQSAFNDDDLYLVTLADMLKAGKGLSMFGTVIQGHMDEMQDEKEMIKNAYARCLENAGVKGFIEVVIHPNVVDGLSCMIQSAGLGALRPNTVLIGWPIEWTENKNMASYNIFLDTMRTVSLCKDALIILKAKSFPCKVAGKDDNVVQIKKDLITYLYQLRIDAIVEVVRMDENDMSAYVYERAMKLEEKTKLLIVLAKRNRFMSTSTGRRNTMLGREVQLVLENARMSRNDISSSIDAYSKKESIYPSPDEIKIMNNALTLNATIRQQSSDAELVILNLPSVPISRKGQANYMTFLEELTDGLSRMLLVRGTGSEVITVYN
ncbi:solute carrier family 12 member 4 [Biomphalaria pfeifferi]|uniref:Solute carrier family 12 member 4 n=1 Tax=Biomphalaria pfeifferi TaxID=112525 RepID=A0AAD8B2N3_BIOPF|nr:solute carrier family 12 member 4 [Biomphalaria pfeifferi]